MFRPLLGESTDLLSLCCLFYSTLNIFSISIILIQNPHETSKIHSDSYNIGSKSQWLKSRVKYDRVILGSIEAQTAKGPRSKQVGRTLSHFLCTCNFYIELYIYNYEYRSTSSIRLQSISLWTQFNSIKPARYNHQPVGHQMSLYVPKKAYFRDNIWPYLGQTTFPLFFVRAQHHNGLERQIFGPKMPNFGRFWAKNPNFYGSK